MGRTLMHTVLRPASISRTYRRTIPGTFRRHRRARLRLPSQALEADTHPLRQGPLQDRRDLHLLVAAVRQTM